MADSVFPSKTEIRKRYGRLWKKDSRLEIILCTGSRGSIERDGEVHCKILPFLSIAQCLKGRYEVALDGGASAVLEQGGAFITRPDQPQRIVHHCPESGGSMAAQWCFFTAVYDGFLDITRCLLPPPTLSPQDAAPFGEIICGICSAAPGEQEALADRLLRETKRQALGFQLLERLLEVSEFIFPEEEYAAILPAVAMMDQTAEGRLRLEQLAQACNMSVTGFTVMFRRLTGASPMSFYRNQRLNRAAAALLTSRKSLGEIAQDCGFYDQFHLSREFKRRYGVSPKQYRQDFYRTADR